MLCIIFSELIILSFYQDFLLRMSFTRICKKRRVSHFPFKLLSKAHFQEYFIFFIQFNRILVSSEFVLISTLTQAPKSFSQPKKKQTKKQPNKKTKPVSQFSPFRPYTPTMWSLKNISQHDSWIHTIAVFPVWCNFVSRIATTRIISLVVNTSMLASSITIVTLIAIYLLRATSAALMSTMSWAWIVTIAVSSFFAIWTWGFGPASWLPWAPAAMLWC